MSSKGSVAFENLGCKLNYAEVSTIARQFSISGYVTVPISQQADIYIISTCSVTEHADKKCRNTIRRLHRLNPAAKIIVTGCYAQLKPDVIASIQGVSAVVGAHDKGRIVEIAEGCTPAVDVIPVEEVNNFFPAYSSGERTRAFLKVQDGCDYHCHYCTVPLARGKSRNISIAEAVSQAQEIAGKGIKEIVITGVNTGDFGKTTGESFLELLKALNEVEGIVRYRISSIEPNLLTEEIVEWIASGTKFLPHFHIPLQSGCDTVLSRMKRRYNTAMFASKINFIRSRIDNVFFGIDVIVGFPGETDEDFQQTYHFLADEIKPAFIHIFPYSRRPNTPAASMPGQVQESIKTQRVAALEELCARLHDNFCKANAGREAEVLFESTQKNGMMYGYSDNYIRVERPYDASLIGTIVKVKIGE